MPDHARVLAQGLPESPREEDMLCDHVRRMGAGRVGAYAVHVHLSQLRPPAPRQQFTRLASRAFEGVIGSHDAMLFKPKNGDLVAVCRDVPVNDMDGAIDRIRALFRDDPMTVGTESTFVDRFTTWYDLSQREDFRALLAVAEGLARETHTVPRRNTAASGAALPGRPLDPASLASINRRLVETRIADLIRQQAAVRVGENGQAQVLFRETFVSIPALQRRIAPDVNLFASPWLFQFLTETLDRRMLALIARQGLPLTDEPISLNLNVGTVLSREFDQFHRRVEASGVVVELQAIDALANFAAFSAARDLLKRRGYRVLVDGLSPLSMHVLDPRLLHADILKLTWNRDFTGEKGRAWMDVLRDTATAGGDVTVVLARAEAEEAIRWGLKHSIRSFQGYFIDQLVAAVSEQEDA